MTFNFANVPLPQKHFNREQLLQQVSEEAIFFLYHGSFALNQMEKSFFRPREKAPSAQFYFNRSARLIYRDYGGDGAYLDCISFVAKLHHLSYYEAIQKIAYDFGLTGAPPSFESTMLNSVVTFERTMKKDLQFQFEIDEWTPEALKPWDRYYINTQELTDNNAFSASRFWINKKRFWFNTRQNRYAFLIYDWKDSTREPYVKIYSPEDTEDNKWRTNAPLDLPFGTETLTFKSNTLVVTKSKKDEITLKKVFPDVLATQNESWKSMPEELLQKLMKRFEYVYFWFDSDKTGLENMIILHEKYGTPFVHTPVDLLAGRNIKDPSDFIESEGPFNFHQLANELIPINDIKLHT